ncbi:virulence-associated E family protein [Bradyrhizobium sp. 160]|uniref:virulence-associated E family protein n=1 Tax=Bradyrhizobium sp. 160 TaxID=2782634 RepID=UPI001FF79513|nr:virulence-associated E family protein [Bradyrhizobium sp. 160]
MNAPVEVLPLYGLQTLGDARQVIVVEGEKCRDALAGETGRTVVSWAGGTQGVQHTDWTPLAGRNVVIWPGADQSADQIASVLTGLKCTVRFLAATNETSLPSVADAIRSGWDKARLDTFMRETVRPWSPPAPPPAEPADEAIAPAGPLERPMAAKPARVAEVTEFKRVDRSNERVGQILGVERFDVEIEAWLEDRGWLVKLNRLSGELEIHLAGGIVPMTDERLAEIRFTVAYAANGKEPAKDKIADAVALIGERRSYHPVRDYLAGLRWDGVERLDEWLMKYAGAEDTPLNRAFGRKILSAAVRRVMQPGAKFDAMLVLEGAQDLGKSSLVRALCRDENWFTDQLEVGADAKVTIEKTSGSWIVEMPELDGMGRRDTNRVKSFITTTRDRSRLAYGRYAVTRDRQFVLFGTTNESHYLSDLTGNRRFWIVRSTKADPAGLAEIRDQLWAEAVAAEPNENLWLEVDLKSAAAKITREASDFGPWLEILGSRIPEGPLKIRVVDVWKLVGFDSPESINKLTKVHHSHIKAAMAGLGFERKDGGIRDLLGKTVKAYVRGDLHEAEWWSPGDPSAAPAVNW